MGLSRRLIRVIVYSCMYLSLPCGQGYSVRNSELPVPRVVVIPANSNNPVQDEVVLHKPPNSDLLVGEGEEIKLNSRITLECDAAYPVQFVYSGDGMPEYTTNTSQSDPVREEGGVGVTKPKLLFEAQLFLGYGRPLGSYDSGKYTCRSLQDARKAVHYNLYVYDGKLFIRQDGETIYYRRSDPSVRIPCSVTHPKAVVSLQKSVNGLVQCPLNDSISFEPTSGFQVKMSPRFDVAGTYVCTAGHMGIYQAMQYVVMSESDGSSSEVSNPNPPQRQPCRRDVDCANNEACLNNGHCGSPCANSCGQNTSCRVVNHLANCQCLPNYQGDPYVACTMSRPEAVKEDPCNPYPCGSNTVCERHNNIAKCSCAPGYQGDPYYRCYRRNDPCNPNPCGPHSVCVNRNNYASCSCAQGLIGTPPHCRAECEQDNHCNYNQVCHQYRCRNPCDGACDNIPNSQCRVINRRPVCARYQSRCPSGYYGRDCSQIYERETIQEKPNSQEEQLVLPIQSPCTPSPCGTDAECVTQQVFNSVFNQTSDVALCQCGPGRTGNADMECYPIEEVRKLTTHEEVRNNDALPEADNVPSSNVTSISTSAPPSSSPIPSSNSNSTADKTTKKCGTNAISIHSADGKSIECHAVIMQMQDDPHQNDLVEPEYCDGRNTSISCGANAYCVLVNGTETCMCMHPFGGDPYVGCELECESDSDCPAEYTCFNQSKRCVDPCEPELQMFFTQCGRDAYCKVEEHKSVCYCPQDLPHGDPNVHCKEKAWMPNHLPPSTPPSCDKEEDKNNCGNNAECRLFHDSKSYCVCMPGFFGDPYDNKGPGCEQGIQCRNSTQCPTNKECVNGRCLDPCRTQKLDCGPYAGCSVDERHGARCICNIGTIRNPAGACEPVKGALAERLALFRSFEDF